MFGEELARGRVNLFLGGNFVVFVASFLLVIVVVINKMVWSLKCVCLSVPLCVCVCVPFHILLPLLLSLKFAALCYQFLLLFNLLSSELLYL